VTARQVKPIPAGIATTDPAADGLAVEIAYSGGAVTVTVRGEIDLASALALQAALDAVESDTHVFVDCADVQFIDSTGVKTLLAATMRLDANGGSLFVRRPSVPVRLALVTSGLEHLLEPER
jgi:anti-sigma B factor antagonist